MIQISQTPDPSMSSLDSNLALVDEDLRRAATEFEAAFIGQMLTFSGVGEALVSGEGKMASAFTGFFVEALAADLAETGAFGLAEKFYEKLKTDGELL